MFFKFVTIKDPHFSFGFMNRIRKDYEKNITDKLLFISDYCKTNQIHNIVFTGDIFDSSTEDKWSFKKYRKNKRALEILGKSNDIKLHSIVGNHDMFHGLESSDETVFGEMCIEGIILNLTKNPIIKNSNKFKFQIEGVNYSNKNETILNKLSIINDDITSDLITKKIVVLHSNIIPDDEEQNEFIDFSYSQLAENFKNINIFICGHFHIGYPTYTYIRQDGSKCIFINNWNMTRVVRDYQATFDNHTPEFEEVSINLETGELSTETIKIPFVKFKEAFNSDNILFNKKSNSQIFNFFENSNLDDIGNIESKSDIEIIQEIKKDKNYSETSAVRAINYLNN